MDKAEFAMRYDILAIKNVSGVLISPYFPLFTILDMATIAKRYSPLVIYA